jgi:arylsulfatase A-like enzyme
MKTFANLDRRGFLKSLAGASAAAALAPKTLRAQQGQQPNIIYFLVDDMGVMDLSCYGSQFYETPNIDALAGQGMKFSQSYVAHPRCVPSRYAGMTGKFPARAGVPGLEYDIHESDFILPEAFKAAGYSTFFCGKWHIGKSAENTYPEQQGFDTNVAGGDNGAPSTYFWPYNVEGSANNLPELEPGGQEGEYLTDRLTSETVNWITANKDQPFFAMLSHYGVHQPLEAKSDIIQKYTIKKDTMTYTGERVIQEFNGASTLQWQDNDVYAAMVESIDDSIKSIMDTLNALGIADNTIILFSSDHGGKSSAASATYNFPTSNKPYRAGKGWLYDGGIIVPTIVKWPGVTAPGSVCDSVINNTDFYPTFLDMAGLPLRPNDHLDGESFVPALQGQPYTRQGALYWHSPVGRPTATGDENSSAIRDGDYKLIDWYDRGLTQLFNIKNDPGENIDLADTETAIAGALFTKLNNWRHDVNAYTNTTPFPPPEVTDGFTSMDAPDFIFINGSYTIKVGYVADGTRDLSVILHEAGDPSRIVGQTTTQVNAGSGTSDIVVTITETLVSGGQYTWAANMYSTGGSTPLDTMTRPTVATDGDIIEEVFAPTTVGPDETVTVRVKSNASGIRDIKVSLISKTTGTRHGATRTTVPAGQNDTDIPVTITGTPPEGPDYKWKVWLMTEGGSESSATDTFIVDNIEVSTQVTVDALLSVSGPLTVNPTGTYTVDVGYSATVDRDIKVAFNAPDGTWHGHTIVTVPAGSSTANIQVNVQANPLPGTGYKWKALLLPVGMTAYADRLDLMTQEGITVEEEVQLTDEIFSVNGPLTVSKRTTYQVSADYSATTTRDIKFVLLDASGRNYGKTIVAVPQGTGTITADLAVKSPKSGSGYHWRAMLCPTGQTTWNDRLDYKDQTGVTVA